MDLFNRKKVKKLQWQVDDLLGKNSLLEQQNEKYRDIANTLDREYKSLDERYNMQFEETRKAYDWIRKILQTFGTVEVGDKT